MRAAHKTLMWGPWIQMEQHSLTLCRRLGAQTVPSFYQPGRLPENKGGRNQLLGRAAWLPDDICPHLAKAGGDTMEAKSTSPVHRWQEHGPGS